MAGERIQEKVDFASFQSVGERFVQDIPIESFGSAVHLIETDGAIYRGAEAVFRMLSYGSRFGSGLGLWCYRPGSWFCLCGSIMGIDWLPVTAESHSLSPKRSGEKARMRFAGLPYYKARTWFLRLLGLVYLIAFWSFWSQIDGLIGHDGILPVAPWLDELRNRFGAEAYRLFPTLCWFNPGDSFLHLLCGGRSRTESAADSADRARFSV